MEKKKLNRKTESDLRDVLKNSYSENVISLLQAIMKYCSQTIMNYCSNNHKKEISEAYLGLCQKTLTTFARKTPSYLFDIVLNMLLKISLLKTRKSITMNENASQSLY